MMRTLAALLAIVSLSSCAALEATWFYLRCDCRQSHSSDSRGDRT